MTLMSETEFQQFLEMPDLGFQVVSFNCQKSSGALHTLFSLFPKCFIFCLQESPIGHQQRLFQQPGFTAISAAGQEILHTAVYIQRNISYMVNITLVENNAIVFTINTEKKLAPMVNVYIPHEKIEEVLEHLFLSLQEKFYILGDFNTHHESWAPRRILARTKAYSIKTNQKTIQEQFVLASEPGIPTKFPQSMIHRLSMIDLV